MLRDLVGLAVWPLVCLSKTFRGFSVLGVWCLPQSLQQELDFGVIAKLKPWRYVCVCFLLLLFLITQWFRR